MIILFSVETVLSCCCCCGWLQVWWYGKGLQCDLRTWWCYTEYHPDCTGN